MPERHLSPHHPHPIADKDISSKAAVLVFDVVKVWVVCIFIHSFKGIMGLRPATVAT